MHVKTSTEETYIRAIKHVKHACNTSIVFFLHMTVGTGSKRVPRVKIKNRVGTCGSINNRDQFFQEPDLTGFGLGFVFFGFGSGTG